MVYRVTPLSVQLSVSDILLQAVQGGDSVAMVSTVAVQGGVG